MYMFVLSLVALLSPLSDAHLSVRYESYPGMNYNPADWFIYRDLDSVGDCANLCTFYTCNLFVTMMFDDISWSPFRGFRCYINIDNIDNNLYGSSPHGHKLHVWLPKTTVSNPRTVTNVPSASPTDECPVVYKKWTEWNSYIWTATASDDGDATSTFDGYNETSYSSSSQNYPWIMIDLGATHKVTKVSILGDVNIQTHPLNNLEVKVGGRNVKSPIDDSKPNGGSILFGNTRCGVFYGPALIENQWTEIDCGYKDGITGRYITFQLLERFIQPSQLEIKEIEVEGFGRICGRPCLQRNVPSVDDFLGNLDYSGPPAGRTDWKLVRFAPQRNEWHDANDKLMGTHSYGTSYNRGNAWSVTWSWDSYDEFLFKVGNDWIIIDKKELLGNNGDTYYNVRSTKVIASSEQCDPHEVIMSRNNNYQEPLVYLTDQGQHHEVMMYAADRRGTNNRAPAEVWIRRRQ